jgi:inhibitor of cysteine peptidase
MKKNLSFHLIWLVSLGTLLLAACTPVVNAQGVETAVPEVPQQATSTPEVIYTPVSSESVPSNPSSSFQQITLNDQDSGKEVQLNLADQLILSLESNPTTGYTWEVETPENPILEQNGDPEYTSNSSLIGSSGKLTFVFTAIKSGQQTLILDYHRTFEVGVAPLQVFQVNVTVAAG